MSYESAEIALGKALRRPVRPWVDPTPGWTDQQLIDASRVNFSPTPLEHGGAVALPGGIDGRTYSAAVNEGKRRGVLHSPKSSFLDKAVDFSIQAVTVAGIGGGLLGIAGVGPAASGGFTPAEIAAGSDAGFLPPPVAATPLVSSAATAATLGTGVVATAKTLGVLAGTATGLSQAANSFKNTKAASDVTPATFPTTRPVWRPADSQLPGGPVQDSGAGWLLLIAALFGGAVLVA